MCKIGEKMGKVDVKFTKVEEKIKTFSELSTGEYFQFSIGSNDLYMKTDMCWGCVRVSGLDGVGRTYVISCGTTRVYDVDIKMEVTPIG